MTVVDHVESPAGDASGRGHVFYSWSAQGQINPVRIQRADGCRIWDDKGNEYLDFSSQAVYTNLGHQHPALVRAIHEQADRLCTIAPQFANDTRDELARLIIEVAPPGMSKVFFTNSGTEAVEHAVRMARLHTGRQKVLSTYRSYHGSTAGAITLTGDPRRWKTEPGVPGSIHFFGPYLYRSAFHAETETQECERAIEHLADVIELEGPATIAAIILEPVVGTNGILVPPVGYLEGVRRLSDKHGILFIADEIMCGFGRVGEWFAVDHYGGQPDLVTFAKGINSGYVPLGGVILSASIAATFDRVAYPGGLTYSGHPLACASGIATFRVFRDEGILEHVRKLGRDTVEPALRELAARHPSIGDVRGRGMLWAIELVKDQKTREPLVPFNASREAARPMKAIVADCRSRGLWLLTSGNRIHLVPPLVITADDYLEGVAIIDAALRSANGRTT